MVLRGCREVKKHLLKQERGSRPDRAAWGARSFRVCMKFWAKPRKGPKIPHERSNVARLPPPVPPGKGSEERQVVCETLCVSQPSWETVTGNPTLPDGARLQGRLAAGCVFMLHV